MAKHSDLLHEAEWRRCARDPAYFFEHYCFVRHPVHGRIPFVMREAQRETLGRFLSEERVIILKARQIGFSTLCANYVLWLAFFHEDQAIIMLSKTERDAVKLLGHAKYSYKLLPEWMKRRGPQTTTDNQLKMTFDNESVVESLPSRDDPARGYTVSLVIVDEWAFLENPEEAWASIEPITDLGGRLIGLSTANGWGNFFHELWVGAEAGNNGFLPIFFPYTAVPERDDRWYEDKVRSMLPWQLHQEYPRDPEEAFIKSGMSVFDLDMLRRFEPLEPEVGQLIELHGPRSFEWRPGRGGALEVWEFPKLEHAYVIGADVAEGLEHGDFSSAHVIDVHTREVVAHWHGHIDPDLFGLELARLGWWYGTALIGCEANNHGLSALDELRRQSYARIFYRRSLDDRTRQQSSKIGWLTTRVSKPVMIDELNMAMRDGELALRSKQTLAELRTYVRDERGGMGGSPFDDRVVSLALANQMRKYAFAPEYETPQSDYGTLEWWLRPEAGAVDPNLIGASNVARRYS